MLEVKGIQARVGDFHLRDICLSVAAGECHAVLGPSGSGKSTLLKTVLGVITPTTGHILLAGEDITARAIERRHIGYVPQRLGLFPHLSVADNLAYGARARKIPPAEFEPLLDRLVEITGIGHLLERLPATLSGGERQRVALVRALAPSRLVLLDEPFTALSESLRRDLWLLVKELQSERGLAVLLVTHDLAEAYFLAQRITVLIDGQQRQSADRRSVYRRPTTLAVARFLGMKNLFEGEVSLARDGRIEVDCPDLGHTFHIADDDSRYASGKSVWLGIRPEHVTLRDTAHPPHPEECILRGSVRLVDLGTDVLIRFRHATSTLIIELVVPERIVARFGLHNGRDGVIVALPEEAVFCMLDE